MTSSEYNYIAFLNWLHNPEGYFGVTDRELDNVEIPEEIIKQLPKENEYGEDL